MPPLPDATRRCFPRLASLAQSSQGGALSPFVLQRCNATAVAVSGGAGRSNTRRLSASSV
eukprot:scaffold49453_cov72-Phaeocystis_antarctica.AAC.3